MGSRNSGGDRFPVALMLCAVLAALASTATPAPAAAWLLAAAAALLPPTLVLLAVREGPRARRLRGVLGALGLLLASGLGGILLVSGAGSGDLRWLGMPPGMALLLVGIWLAPFPIVVLAYLLTFDGRHRSGPVERGRR